MKFNLINFLSKFKGFLTFFLFKNFFSSFIVGLFLIPFYSFLKVRNKSKSGTPILFVHGYLSHPSTWLVFSKAIRKFSSKCNTILMPLSLFHSEHSSPI